MKYAEKLIDWTQWTGEDFFTVQPYKSQILMTKRVVDALEELRVKSYRLENFQTIARRIAEGPRLETTPNEEELHQISTRIRETEGAGRQGALVELLELASRDASMVGEVAHRCLN